MNADVLWSELLKRLSTTSYTQESFDEFWEFSKQKQDEIKDVGGFVGGTLRDGRRRNESLESRSLITLDADFASKGLWEDISSRFNFACCMYSTHKHCPDKPRYRIVIPLKRALTPDEYQAVSRRVAFDFGMEMFDDTTHEPARMMYWPSTSHDGVFEFYYQDKEWLDPDGILESYGDWRDTRFWSDERRAGSTKKCERPGEKRGAQGAFCRTYSIPRAIEKFLSDVYEPCDDGARYTYKQGTTTGGLAIYDDGDFAYSYHGTDPAGRRLLNAFDLVRFHRFGHLDLEAAEGTPAVKLPSWRSMEKFALADDVVKVTLGKERLSGLSDSSVIEEDMEWLKLMEMDNKGKFTQTIANCVTILENDPNLKGKIAMNEFAYRLIKIGNLPWCRLLNPENGDLWKDEDDASLRYYIERAYGISASNKIDDALLIIQQKNKFHPVRNYLNSLAWDGVKRVESIFIDYLGVEDSQYSRAVTRKMMAAACARVFQPGIKFDYMLVLAGGQGIGKSQFLRRLGKSWYSDSVMSIQGKEGFEQLQGVWILEMGELAATKKAAVEHVKQYISKCEDYFRPAYGRHAEVFYRQCVLFGTSNENEFLKDKTGNRRFWPVTVGVNREKEDGWKSITEETIDQIWAEALEIYRAGEELYLSGEVEREARMRQELHTESAISEGVIAEYLNMLLPEGWYNMDLFQRRNYIHGGELQGKKEGKAARNKVCVAEIWSELLRGEMKDPAARVYTREIHEILGRLEGWRPYTKGTGKLRFGFYGPQKAYVRVGAEEREME